MRQHYDATFDEWFTELEGRHFHLAVEQMGNEQLSNQPLEICSTQGVLQLETPYASLPPPVLRDMSDKWIPPRQRSNEPGAFSSPDEASLGLMGTWITPTNDLPTDHPRGGHMDLIMEERSEIQKDEKSVCRICGVDFNTSTSLEVHARAKKHRTYACSEAGCFKTYYRRDTFVRHMTTNHRASDTYSCSYCAKNPRQKFFKRRDHLQQHIRNCHPDKAKHNNLAENIFDTRAPTSFDAYGLVQNPSMKREINCDQFDSDMDFENYSRAITPENSPTTISDALSMIANLLRKNDASQEDACLLERAAALVHEAASMEPEGFPAQERARLQDLAGRLVAPQA